MAGDRGRARIAAVGAGRMGRGIAHAFAYAGHTVDLIDTKPRSAAAFATIRTEALAEITTSLQSLADAGLFDAAHVPTIGARVNLHDSAAAPAALAAADVIFEGVPETQDAKRDALAFIDAHARRDAIVASTTSTFLSTLLATMTVRPERFLNAHWLNPAYLIPLVEVSPHPGTDATITERLNTLLRAIGKVPVVCKASPGYIVPRIQALAMNEAARLVEEGVATAEDVDKAILYGFGPRFAVLGLVEFIDWGGVDILYYASRYMAAATGSDRFKAPAIINESMAAGHIGMKSGQGLIDWSSRDVDAHRKHRIAEFVGLLQRMGKLSKPEV